jgi:RpiR family carbohydrate utilization transcriptional regulator
MGGTMTKSRLQTRNLNELIARLSSKRQEIMRPVQEHPHEFVLLTVRELAKRLGTDTATLLRAVRGMGFTGYREFREYLHAVSVSQFSLLSAYDGKEPGSDIAAHARRSIDRSLKNLQGLKNTLNFQQLAALPRRIHKARRVLLFGGDAAISLVTCLQYYFMLLGIPVETGITPGQTVHLARTCGRRDLVIAISFQRGLRQTVEGLQQARANGAYCVGLTDTFVSPIARYANERFLVSVNAPFGTSYAAPMAFLNALVTACAYFRRRRTLALMHKADQEQQHGSRWYS